MDSTSVDQRIKDRVARALQLPPATLHGDLWIVQGQSRNYTVSLDHPNTVDGVACFGCPDREHYGIDHQVACKHILRATIDAARLNCRRRPKIIRH